MPRPAMNTNRAALVEILRRYAAQAVIAPGLIESQKLLYFLQTAGQPLRLNFKQHHHGPYADNLRHVLNLVEGHFISGFGDDSARIVEAEPLIVLPDAAEEAQSFLPDDPDTKDRIQSVLALTDGFESAYGLELLATVHWTASHDAAATDEELAKSFWDRSPRKARMFTERHVRIALDALRDQGWLASEFVAA